MNDPKLALRISTNGAGQARAELEGVSKAEDAVGRSATSAAGGVDKFDASLDQATNSGRDLSVVLGEIGPKSVSATTQLAAFGTQGSATLKALEAQATATQRSLSQALGMSGVRNLSQESSQAKALAALQAESAASLAAAESALAQARAGSIQGLLDEARAVSALGTATSQTAGRVQQFTATESDLRTIIGGIETAHERHATQLQKINALFESGALTVGQYHRAIDVANQQLDAATKSTSQFSASAKAMFAALAAGTGIGLAKGLYDTDKALQGVDARIGFFAKNAADANRIQAELVATAKDLRTNYLLVGDAYARLMPLEQSALITHRQTQELLTGMSNAGKALGASNEQIKQSLFGFSQGAASAVLHAEELNQTVEPLPGLLQAMDRAAMLPAGGFRALTNEGKVTSQMFVETLVKALHEFDGAAARTANNLTAFEENVRSSWQNLAKEADGIISTIAKTGSNATSHVIDHVSMMIGLYKKGWNNLAGVIGNGVPDDAMAAERAAQRPEQQASIGPTIDDKTLKERQKDITDAAKAAEQASERLTRTKIDLLKAQGQYAEALTLEAQLYKLSGDQAKQYVADELATIKAKEASQAATKAGTKAIHDQSAALTLLSNLLEKSNPWEKHQARMKDVDQAISTLAAAGQAPSGDDLARISQALNEQYRRETEAWAKSDEAMAAHVEAYKSHQVVVADLIKTQTEEADLLKYTGKELAVQTALRKANATATSEEGKAIAASAANLFDAQKAAQAAADSAGAWRTAWEQGIRRVDDIAADFWHNLFTGSKSTFASLKSMFLDMLAEMANAAITRPIILSVMGGLGFGSSNAMAAGMQGGIGSLLGSGIASGLGSLFNSGVSALGLGNLSLLGLGGSAGSGSPGGLFGLASSGASAGAGLLTGLQSPFMAGLGAQLGSSLGVGLTGTAALAYAGLNSPFAAIGGLLANLMGIRGGSTAANIAFPTVGGLAGGALGGLAAGAVAAAVGSTFGTSAGAMAGAAAGPIGAIIGALLGATASMLFKAAKPNAGAEFTFGADNSLTTTWTRDHAGGKSSTLVGLADQLPQSLTSLERILGVELGQFNFGMQNEHNRSLYIAGSDAKGRFYYDVSAMYDKKGRFQEEAVKQSLDKFVAAVLKRGTVLNQIDDELVRGAIASSNKLSEAQAKLKTVAKIEAYTGEKTSLGDTLTQARVDYEKWTAWVSANVRKSTRADELDKLTTAYLGKFSDAVAQFNDGLAQLTGATTDTIGAALRNIHSQFVSIRAQNRELAQAAKASGGKVSYTPLTDSELAAAEASAVGKARNDVLAYIRQLTGASQPLADQIDNVAEYFANVRDHANDLGISLDWLADQEAQAIATLKNAWANGVKDTINASARAVRDAIAGNDGTIARLTKDINAGMADIAQLDNQSSIESAIAKISSLIKQRYDLEISSISATISAAKGLRDYVGSLGSSDLSPYSPGEKLSLAGANYGEILLKAQAGDPNAASQLQGAFSSYLQLAASNYGTASAEYRSIFEGGKAALDQVSQNILTGAEARITNLTQSALALVDTLTAMAQTQIVAIQNNTAALAANTDALTGAAKDQVSALDAHGQLLQDMLNTPASPTPSASLLLAGWQK